MMMNGNSFGLLASVVLLGFGSRWLYLMQRSRIPADIRGFAGASALAVLLGIAALAAGPGLSGAVAAAVSVAGGLAFIGLWAASGQAKIASKAVVGRPIPEFTAKDEAGRVFELARLRGKPFLIKFFRGHWCPYCVAELKRWEKEIRPALDAHGVSIVTVCADTDEEIRRERSKHGLRAVMLPDPDLAITDLYNLRNPKNFAPRPGVVIPLPIPTTILVDAAGIVRWVDQASDYMHRSEPERVLGAVRAMLNGSVADAPQEVAGPRPRRREDRSGFEAEVGASCSPDAVR